MKSFWFSKIGLFSLAVITCAAIALTQYVGRSYRFDLTENHLFTLSQGSKNILQTVNQPIELTLFFSDQQTKTIPELRNYVQRVRDLLKEYVLRSNGQLHLVEVDPEPFSEAEDRASSAGLKSVPLSEGGDPIYFGLMGTNAQGKRENIAFFSPVRERFLEYDISQMIYRLAHPQLRKVGLITGLPMKGGFDVLQQRPTPAWVTFTQMTQLYDVQELNTDTPTIDKAIEILLLVHPKQLPAETVYAIDQFVLRGGQLIVFVDPWAEADPAEHESHSSDQLTPLFKEWGVYWSAQQVLTDAQNALSVSKPSSSEVERHLALIGLTGDSFAKNQVVTDRLESVNVATAGSLQPLKGATTQFISLMRSSKQSMLMPRERFEELRDASRLFKDFKPSGKAYTVMADITGSAKSAFPQGFRDRNGFVFLPHLSHSTQPIHVMVIADTDLLTDRLWVQVQDFFGQSVAQPFANNGDLMVNVLDYMAGSPDLIQIRSRDRYQRPFDRVNALQLKAEQAFRKSEEALQAHLSETERKLAALQRAAPSNEVTAPQQQKTLENFQQEKIKIRKQLRDVRHQLDEDIERLGLWLKVINILLVPIILTLVIVVFAARKRRRRG